ncbi:MAG: hypothetical protein ACJ8H8_29855 [Geminicoccaceae bacterium]
MGELAGVPFCIQLRQIGVFAPRSQFVNEPRLEQGFLDAARVPSRQALQHPIQQVCRVDAGRRQVAGGSYRAATCIRLHFGGLGRAGSQGSREFKIWCDWVIGLHFSARGAGHAGQAALSLRWDIYILFKTLSV